MGPNLTDYVATCAETAHSPYDLQAIATQRESMLAIAARTRTCSIYLSIYLSIYIYIYIYAVGRGFGPLEGPFLSKKMLLAAEPSISSKGILPKKRGTKFKVFWDQIPWLVGPNSLTYFFRFNTHLSTFVSMARNPYFCSVFLKFCVLHEDISKMARNACQKECYYLVKCARGWFLCWDQIPLRAIFAFSPVGLLKPFFSPETTIFIGPPHYFLPHFTVSPFKDPKKCPKNIPTRGANSTLFFDPYFRSVFRPFLAQKCETAIHPYISSTALEPPTHYISSVFLSMHPKKRRQTSTRGDQIPFLYLPR